MDDNIQNYRSPMVTAIGIILGFVLGFTATWATQPVTETDWSDLLIGVGLMASVILLIISLYRILNNKYPAENAGRYYQKTLRYFIVGLCTAFLGILFSIFQVILNH